MNSKQRDRFVKALLLRHIDAYGTVVIDDKVPKIEVDLCDGSIVNLKRLQGLAAAFGTDDISFNVHTPSTYYSEQTMDPDVPEQLVIRFFKLAEKKTA